jgi:hypothetical protein
LFISHTRRARAFSDVASEPTLDAIADQMTLEQTPTRDQIANALTHSEGKVRHDSSIKALFPVA